MRTQPLKMPGRVEIPALWIATVTGDAEADIDFELAVMSSFEL